MKIILSAENYADCFECHIKSDLLLIYEVDKSRNTLTVVDIGSHSDLLLNCRGSSANYLPSNLKKSERESRACRKIEMSVPRLISFA